MFTMNTQAQVAFESNTCEPTVCCDTPEFYVKGLGGLNFIQVRNHGFTSRIKTGYIASATVGYRLGYDLRVEGEYAYRRNRFKHVSGNVNANSFMANLLWDMPVGQCGCDLLDLTPYVGAGIGYDIQKVNVSVRTGRHSRQSFHHTKKSFAWQAIAGVSVPVYCNTDMSLEYKFHQATSTRIYDHSIGLGVTYNFGA